MRPFDYFLTICGGLVLIEAGVIITLNTKRGYWEPTNKFHLLLTVFYLTYLLVGIFSTYWGSRSEYYCDTLWKVCSTLYIAVNMSVYSFYYVKSKLVNNTLWRGRHRSRGLVLVFIAMMGIGGMSIIWAPISGFQYYGKLVNGECWSANRRWIVITWVVSDSLLSILLLVLFIRPIKVINSTLGDTPRSVATLRSMKRMTEKNRNLLFITILVSTGIFTAIAILGKLQLRNAIYLCAVDRLVTLQCITMTFTYDGKEYFYCRACFILCFQDASREVEEKEHCYYSMNTRTSRSTSLIVLSTSSGYEKVTSSGNDDYK